MQGVRHNIQLYLRKGEHLLQAKFGDCIVAVLENKNECRDVNVELVYDPIKSEMVLSTRKNMEARGLELLRLKHAKECPALHMTPELRTELPDSVREKGVRVGVSVLLTSVDNHVLLTRRAWHMRTFPGVWVPPGGHVEKDETLEQAGLRELHEETGIDLTILDDGLSVAPLCLWESLYPPALEYGSPTYQHLVVYLIAYSNLSSSSLLDRIKMDPNEVDASLLLPLNYVEALTTGRRVGLSDSLPVITVSSSGEHIRSQISNEIILTKAPEEGVSEIAMERLSWGTRYALKEWMEKVKIHNSSL